MYTMNVVKSANFTEVTFMVKNLVYGELLDIYKSLLTEKQSVAMEYYYNRDYSLGEISELMDISRQGVRDFIKRGEAVMDEMESKLQLIEKFRAANSILDLAKEIKAINKKLAESKEIDRLSDEIIEAVKLIENGEE